MQRTTRDLTCNHKDKRDTITIIDTVYVKNNNRKEIERLKKKITLMELNLKIEKSKNER